MIVMLSLEYLGSLASGLDTHTTLLVYWRPKGIHLLLCTLPLFLGTKNNGKAIEISREVRCSSCQSEQGKGTALKVEDAMDFVYFYI